MIHGGFLGAVAECPLNKEQVGLEFQAMIFTSKEEIIVPEVD